MSPQDILAMLQQQQQGNDQSDALLASLDPASRQLVEFMREHQARKVADVDAAQESAVGGMLRAIKPIKPYPTDIEWQTHAVPQPPTNKSLRSDTLWLTAVNDRLAATFGACEECWGNDRHCLQCRGAGVPGWRQPDRILFDEIAGNAAAILRSAVTPASPADRPGATGRQGRNFHRRDNDQHEE